MLPNSRLSQKQNELIDAFALVPLV